MQSSRSGGSTSMMFLLSVLGKTCQTAGIVDGLQAYACYTIFSLTPPQNTLVESLVADTGAFADSDGSVERAMSLVTQIVEILREHLSNDRLSIDDVVSHLLTLYDLDDIKRENLRHRCRHLVFVTIGFSTMLLKPIQTFPLTDFHVSRANHHSRKPRTVGVDISRRPIAAVLNGFGVHQGTSNELTLRLSESSNAPGLHTDAVTSANVALSAIKALGKVSLDWVDSIEGHLEFDADRRVLSLFRFPSFCAAVYLGGTDCVLAR